MGERRKDIAVGSSPQAAGWACALSMCTLPSCCHPFTYVSHGRLELQVSYDQIKEIRSAPRAFGLWGGEHSLLLPWHVWGCCQGSAGDWLPDNDPRKQVKFACVLLALQTW